MPSILHTKQGGTGSNSVPLENQIPIGDANGNYQPNLTLDTDTGLTSDSDSFVSSQHAVKTYVDTSISTCQNLLHLKEQ